MSERNVNMKAFDLDCKLCRKERSSLGTSIPDRVKAYQHVPYLWCTRCDRA